MANYCANDNPERDIADPPPSLDYQRPGTGSPSPPEKKPRLRAWVSVLLFAFSLACLCLIRALFDRVYGEGAANAIILALISFFAGMSALAAGVTILPNLHQLCTEHRRFGASVIGFGVLTIGAWAMALFILLARLLS